MSWSVGFGVLCDEQLVTSRTSPSLGIHASAAFRQVQQAMLNMHANMLMHAKRDNTKLRAITGMWM